MKDYGGLGGLKTISIRNLGAAHTAVSYDGIAVSNSQAGQIDIGRFATDNISTLSLSIGQSDNLLQSARMYASAGILHIVTEQPKFISNKNTISTDKLKEVLSVCSIASHVGNNKWELTQPLLLMGISCVQMERILYNREWEIYCYRKAIQFRHFSYQGEINFSINSLTVAIGIPKLITIIPNEGFPVQSSYIIRNLMND